VIIDKVVVALDPGRTTGYAIGSIDEDRMYIRYGQKKWNHLELLTFLRERQSDHIVCESFVYRQGSTEGADLYPCELIGIVELAHQTFQPQPTVYYQNSSAQGKTAYFGNARLKQMGLYIRGLDHGRSALKHLLQWTQFGPGSVYGITEYILKGP